MTIETWGPKLTEVLAAVDGMTQVDQFNDLPGVIDVFPSSVWLPTGIPILTYGLSTPTIMITQVQITTYFSASLLPTGVGEAVLFTSKILRALAANMTLGGTVNCIMPRADGPVAEGPAGLSYGTGVFTGVNFFYEVKESNLDFVVSM